MLSKSSCISVQLLEPTIYVESNSDACNVVRGTININLPKTTTVKSISVRFDGKMETKSYSFDSMDAGGFAQKKPLARQRLVLYPTMEQVDANRPLVMNAGLTQFGFEMQIPSKLPETIDCSDVKVSYHVTAVMEYQSNSFLRVGRSSTVKEFAKQDVRVARLPYENILVGDNMSEPIDSRTHRSAWLHYQILVDKKAVALGSELPITFRMLPTHNGVSVDRVAIQMLERRDLFRESTHTSHSVHSILPSASNKTTIPTTALSEPWEGTVKYDIPEGKSLVHSTQEYSDFNVSHTLLVSIALSVPGTGRFTASRVQKMVTFQASIDILDETIGELDSLKLPTYDSPPPFDNSDFVFGEYDRKFADPPAYSEIYATEEHN
ncbi:unnamed protein product [Mucor circinelloides]|uniref:Arrestin C-terminal-like domain-containing protein n=1 Tax=Mucor circinelloides f. circinelloides (strain 1006PhL) TaxID=1220926 RepID=S2IYZ7_MUCC1|nr:hypothetical protein HMPREF1544_10784 [Mucor circinelloides 1006PhL]